MFCLGEYLRLVVVRTETIFSVLKTRTIILWRSWVYDITAIFRFSSHFHTMSMPLGFINFIYNFCRYHFSWRINNSRIFLNCLIFSLPFVLFYLLFIYIDFQSQDCLPMGVSFSLDLSLESPYALQLTMTRWQLLIPLYLDKNVLTSIWTT